jgi:hypothetical protein
MADHEALVSTDRKEIEAEAEAVENLAAMQKR